MEAITLYTGSTGLNTVDDPVRIPFDKETGVTGLAEAVNVSITRSGRIGRRKGYQKIATGIFHSLFCNQGNAYIAKDRQQDTAIFRINNDLSLKGVRSGLEKHSRIGWCQHPSGKVFYSNGQQKGYIIEDTSYPWKVGEYYGPDTLRNFTGPPDGNHLEYAFGRMFIGQDKIVWWSEPYRVDLYDLTRNFWQFGSCVRMIKAVATGLFISDEKSTWFYQGTNPYEATPIKVANYPALEWSEVYDMVEAAEIGLDTGGLCACWISTEGACIGTPDGKMINLNRKQVIYPGQITRGASVLHGFNLIHTMR